MFGHNIKTISFISILILSITISINARVQHWQNLATRWNTLGIPFDFVDPKAQPRPLDEFDCNYGQCDDGKAELDRLRMIETNELQFKRRPSYDVDSTSIIPYFHTSPSQPCSCTANRFFEDLGISNWPRYVHTAQCNADICGAGPYKCRQLAYNVRVLNKRSPGDPIDEHLPEILRKDWKFKTVTVNVACECKLSE